MANKFSDENGIVLDPLEHPKDVSLSIQKIQFLELGVSRGAI